MKTVVVTGASSGIGLACCLRLARGGWSVFGGVRTEEDAAAFRGRGLEPLLLDVTDSVADRGSRGRGRPEPRRPRRQRRDRDRGAARARPARRAPAPARGERRRAGGGDAGIPARAPSGKRTRRPHGLDRRQERAPVPRSLCGVEARPRGDRRLAARRAAPVGDARLDRRAGEHRDGDLAEGRGARRATCRPGQTQTSSSSTPRRSRASGKSRSHAAREPTPTSWRRPSSTRSRPSGRRRATSSAVTPIYARGSSACPRGSATASSRRP